MQQLEVFLTALRLGLTSFGGPVAHISYFHDEYVKKKKWISEQAYAELVALCQFLPGPASSQIGMAIGLSRAGIMGAIIAWLGFTLPSAVLLILFGLGLAHVDVADYQHALHGLKVAAVAIVAQAVFVMAKKLCPDKERAAIALASAAFVLFFSSVLSQILVLIIAASLGFYFLKPTVELPHEPLHQGKKGRGALVLGLFFCLLFLLPFLRIIYPAQEIKLIDSFFRAGSLVFGGGHVVLPMLQTEVVSTGWVTKDLFMAGYGLANAIPGPLFTFSSYLGAVSSVPPKGLLGAVICLIAVFLPSFLLIVGVLPFWEKLRSLSKIRQCLLAMNAAVVGILVAALYNPVWTSAIFSVKDFALAALGFFLLERLKIPSWSVVLFTVFANSIYSLLR